MSTEDRLRDALHDAVDGIDPAPGSWERIAARLEPPGRSPRRSPRFVALVAAAACVVVLTVVVVAVRAGDDSGRERVATRGHAPVPRVLMVRSEGSVNELLPDEAWFDWPDTAPVSGLSGMPDGRSVVFARARGAPCSEVDGSFQPQIERLELTEPVAGQTTRIVGGAASPVVSPDGRYVAYGIECDGIELGITDLRTGENFRPAFLSPEAESRERTRVEPLGWSPDSRRIVFRVTFDGDGPPAYFAGAFPPVVDETEEELAALPWEHGLAAAAFVGDDEVALALGDRDGSVVRRWRLGSGADLAGSPVLFRTDRAIRSLVADPSGEHLLVLTADGILHRWSVGDPAPVRLADGVTAAAWLGGR